MENAAIIRKAFGDYIDTKTNNYGCGDFWEIKVEDLTIRRGGYISKAEIIRHIQNNFGDIDIYLKVASAA